MYITYIYKHISCSKLVSLLDTKKYISYVYKFISLIKNKFLA